MNFLKTFAILLTALMLFAWTDAHSQEFTFPDSIKMRQLIRNSPSHIEAGYLSLLANFDTIAPKDSVQYYSFDQSTICSFSQEFEGEILYMLWQCAEGKGMKITIVFPIMNRERVYEYVEYLAKVSFNRNEWDHDMTTYEPKEKSGGCYYRVSENQNKLVVSYYCGC